MPQILPSFPVSQFLHESNEFLRPYGSRPVQLARGEELGDVELLHELPVVVVRSRDESEIAEEDGIVERRLLEIYTMDLTLV